MKRICLHSITFGDQRELNTPESTIDESQNEPCEFHSAIKKTNYFRMKKWIQPLSLFAMGFVLMATLQLLTQCIFNNDDDLLKNSINPEELKEDIDYDGIHKLSEQLEDAFLDSDQALLDELMFNGPGENYKEKNSAYTAEELAAIGKALKKKELSAASSVFAEYSYIIDGSEYTLTLGINDQGEWKLVRY